MSTPKIDDFSKRIVTELNLTHELEPNIDLSMLPEFDSMGKINVSLLIEEMFRFQIDFEDLNSCKTLSDLYNFCIENKEF